MYKSSDGNYMINITGWLNESEEQDPLEYVEIQTLCQMADDIKSGKLNPNTHD
jgi:hypothetical protein